MEQYELYNPNTGQVEDVMEMTAVDAEAANATRRAAGDDSRWIQAETEA